MNELAQLIIRHVLACAGAALEHHGITTSSTVSMLAGSALLAVPILWSWLAKLLHIDQATGYNLTRNDAFRAGLQALLSKGVAVLSVWLACDANNPALLLVALANAAASHLGLHQRIAFAGSDTLKDIAGKASLLIACFALCQCAAMTAWLASPAGVATERVVVGLADIGLQAAVDHGKLNTGDAVILQRGLAVVTNPGDSTTVKVFNLAELGLSAAVSKGLVKPGDSVLIQDAAAVIQRAVVAPQSGKQPKPVLP